MSRWWLVYRTFYLFERQRARDRERMFLLLVHSPQNAYNSQVWARRTRNQDLDPSLPDGLLRPDHLSHHLLPPMVCVRRKLELKVELELKPRHVDVGCSQLGQGLHGCTILLPFRTIS